MRDIKLEKPDARGCRNKFEQLQSRDDQGNYFWELRSCVYWHEFEKPKLVIPAITSDVEYAVDYEKHFANDKTSICVTSEPNYLVGLELKSSLGVSSANGKSEQAGWFLRIFKPMYVSALPIPAAPPEKQKPVERLVERILSAKQRDAGADVSALERELDELVYALYGLTPEEIKLVEGKFALRPTCIIQSIENVQRKAARTRTN